MSSSNRDPMDDYLLKTLNTIGEHGWMVQGVFGNDADETGFAPSFQYTVGLTAQEPGLPELFIDRLGPEQGAPVLNGVAKVLIAGTPATHGALIDGEFTVEFRLHGPIDWRLAECFMAQRVYGDDLSVMQVLWPDPADNFPGDADYDQTQFPQRLMPLADANARSQEGGDST